MAVKVKYSVSLAVPHDAELSLSVYGTDATLSIYHSPAAKEALNAIIDAAEELLSAVNTASAIPDYVNL